MDTYCRVKSADMCSTSFPHPTLHSFVEKRLHFSTFLGLIPSSLALSATVYREKSKKRVLLIFNRLKSYSRAKTKRKNFLWLSQKKADGVTRTVLSKTQEGRLGVVFNKPLSGDCDSPITTPVLQLTIIHSLLFSCKMGQMLLDWPKICFNTGFTIVNRSTHEPSKVLVNLPPPRLTCHLPLDVPLSNPPSPLWQRMTRLGPKHLQFCRWQAGSTSRQKSLLTPRCGTNEESVKCHNVHQRPILLKTHVIQLNSVSSNFLVNQQVTGKLLVWTGRLLA